LPTGPMVAPVPGVTTGDCPAIAPHHRTAAERCPFMRSGQAAYPRPPRAPARAPRGPWQALGTGRASSPGVRALRAGPPPWGPAGPAEVADALDADGVLAQPHPSRSGGCMRRRTGGGGKSRPPPLDHGHRLANGHRRGLRCGPGTAGPHTGDPAATPRSASPDRSAGAVPDPAGCARFAMGLLTGQDPAEAGKRRGHRVSPRARASPSLRVTPGCCASEWQWGSIKYTHKCFKI